MTQCRTPEKTAGRALSGLLLSAAATTLMACSSASSPAAAAQTAPPSADISASGVTEDYITRPPEDDVVYFMLPDRFNNGKTDNDTGGLEGDRYDHGFDPTDKAYYHGGDLVGLTEKLDYIQGMGASAIWLGPIYKNKPVQGADPWISAGYHGYWITDFTTVDPHLGTEDELKTFIDSAHARGMKVYLDIITNHTADVISLRECHDPDYDGDDKVDGPCAYRNKADYPYTTRGGIDGAPINDGFLGDAGHLQTSGNFGNLTAPNYAYTPYVSPEEANVKVPAWLNDPIYYHNRGESEWEGESAVYGDFSGLDDLMTENPVVIDGMIDIFKDWVSTYRVDGFRIDTAKHVNPEFWHAFVPAMKKHAAAEGIPNFYIFGEAYYGLQPDMLAWHTREGGFDQVLDFAIGEAILQGLTGEAQSRALEDMLTIDALYAEGQSTARRLPTFVSNHDKGRISGLIKERVPGISQDDLLARTVLAHELLMFMRGVPVIYSGDEQGFVSDGNDQLARENLFPSQVDLYNDNDLIGTYATTAEENFDRDHPLYVAIRQSAKIRKDHDAFRRGRTIPRYSEVDGGVFAFSRLSPTTGHEYIVAANMSADSRQVNVEIDPYSDEFETLRGTCPAAASAVGTMAFDLPPFGLAVCRASRPASLASANESP